MTETALPDSIDVLVIGGGQAGLGIGYRLREAGVPFVIVDDRARAGDVWRERWRSLVLFTPRRWASLPGLSLPRDTANYPTRSQLADYLEEYSETFSLPIAHNTRVTSVRRDATGFIVECGDTVVRARAVVVASGPFQYPRVPRVSAKLAPDVAQLHSSAYTSAADVPRGRTAVVGGGNSAAQLAVELADTHDVTMVASQKPWFIPERLLGISVYWPLSLFGILSSPSTSRISEYIHSRGDGILGTEAQRTVRRKKMRLLTSRVVDAEPNALVLADGTRLEVDAVLWATGFRTHYPFVNVDGALTEHGAPLHEHGVSPAAGLYWLGLPWQNRLDSSILHGIAADSRDLLAALLARLSGAPTATSVTAVAGTPARSATMES